MTESALSIYILTITAIEYYASKYITGYDTHISFLTANISEES